MKKGQCAVRPQNLKKTQVIKGSQNWSEDANIDANKMARMQMEKIKEAQILKKEKIQNFMNNTKLNASKLSKQQTKKNKEQMDSKKLILQRQKQLKAKYTKVKKQQKIESTKRIRVQPTQVNWKKAEDLYDKILPNQYSERHEESGDESGYDSEVDPEKNQNPTQVIKQKQSIRELMLRKSKG